MGCFCPAKMLLSVDWPQVWRIWWLQQRYDMDTFSKTLTSHLFPWEIVFKFSLVLCSLTHSSGADELYQNQREHRRTHTCYLCVCSHTHNEHIRLPFLSVAIREIQKSSHCKLCLLAKLKHHHLGYTSQKNLQSVALRLILYHVCGKWHTKLFSCIQETEEKEEQISQVHHWPASSCLCDAVTATL